MGLSEYQRKEFDPNNCHPHHERWEAAITHTESEFRRVLQSAYNAGFGFGRLYEAQGDWPEETFEEWFQRSYGDIIESGDISPVDEETDIKKA